MKLEEHGTGWVTVSAADDSYRLSMPGSPSALREVRTTQRGPLEQMKLDYRDTKESRAWIAYVFDRRPEDMKPTTLELRYQQQALAVSFDGRVREAHEGRLRGLPAREVVVEGFGNGSLIATALIVVRETRVFWLIAVIPNGQEAKLAGTIARYFDSLDAQPPKKR
jgi:hypothetical protein